MDQLRGVKRRRPKTINTVCFVNVTTFVLQNPDIIYPFVQQYYKK